MTGIQYSPGAPGPLAPRLQDFLDAARARHGFPGATAAIVDAQGRLSNAAAGLADIEANLPMTAGTRMLAASIGKTFVAATLLSLEAEEHLSCADPLSRHLGDRQWFSRLPNAGDITLQHLLRHTAGLPDHVNTTGFAAAFAQGQTMALPHEALVGFILDAPPLAPAGALWSYTDTGYILLGLVIEAAAGARIEALVSERFLAPLDLRATIPSNRPDLPGLAVGYTGPDNTFGLPPRTADPAGRLLWNPANEWTGGGWASTSADLACWGHALFGGQVLPPSGLAAMLTGIPRAPETPEDCYGFGVYLHRHPRHGAVQGHGGWVPGYVSGLRHYADHGITAALQINTDLGSEPGAPPLVWELEQGLADLALAAPAG